METAEALIHSLSDGDLVAQYEADCRFSELLARRAGVGPVFILYRRAGAMKEILSIERQELPDDYPDLSWLHQDIKEVREPELRDEDAARLAAYERGDWQMIGVRAVATLRINGIMQTIESPGLWGIESDSGEEYLDSVYHEEIETLTDMLNELGFSRDDVAAVAS